MFWKILLGIYLAITISVIVFEWLLAVSVSKDLNLGKKKEEKLSAEGMSALLRIIFVCVIPIFNLILFLSFLFKWDYMKKAAIETAQKQLNKGE